MLGVLSKICSQDGPFRRSTSKIPRRKLKTLIASVVKTWQDYTASPGNFSRRLALTNTDFDTGHDTGSGSTPSPIRRYARLLDQLSGHNFDQIDPICGRTFWPFMATRTHPTRSRKNRLTGKRSGRISEAPCASGACAGWKQAEGQVEPKPSLLNFSWETRTN